MKKKQSFRKNKLICSIVIAKIRMARWVRLLTHQLEAAGLKVWLVAFYVDGIRLVVSPLQKGWKFKPPSRRYHSDEQAHQESYLEFSEEWKVEDMKDTRSDTRRTEEEILKVMNHIDSDLNFTIELMEDYPDDQHE